MSVNKYDPTTNQLITIANNSRVWIGSQDAHQAAIENGTMPNNCMVHITDEYTDSIIDSEPVKDSLHLISSGAVFSALNGVENITSQIKYNPNIFSSAAMDESESFHFSCYKCGPLVFVSLDYINTDYHPNGKSTYPMIPSSTLAFGNFPKAIPTRFSIPYSMNSINFPTSTAGVSADVPYYNPMFQYRPSQTFYMGTVGYNDITSAITSYPDAATGLTDDFCPTGKSFIRFKGDSGTQQGRINCSFIYFTDEV